MSVYYEVITDARTGQVRRRDFTAAEIAAIESLPTFVPPSLTFAQLLIGLVAEGWISEAEGEAWLDGQLPAPFVALIATLPVGQRFAAKARGKRPSAIMRADPLVAALAAAQQKTAAELDAFFRTYAAI